MVQVQFREKSCELACLLLAQADLDGSGTVSREELRDALRAMWRSKGKGEEEGAFERAFDKWLEREFLPPAFLSIKKKRLLQHESVATIAAMVQARASQSLREEQEARHS